jgi:alkyldihydroxyacetonephosphate synthase
MTAPLATSFSRWGTPPAPVGIPERARAYLLDVVGAATPRPAVAVADVQLPPSQAPEPLLSALAAAVGPDAVRTDRESRLAACAGSSLSDLARRRAGDVAEAPDVVVLPTTADEVAAVLAVAREQRAAVVTLGGGTSVVGGVAMRRAGFDAVVALSTQRLDAIGEVDPVSCLVTVGPGVTGPVLERLLQARGFTLGHLPQSWERATIGGYVATRSAGQASSGYGRSDEMVHGLRVVTPVGEIVLGHGPATAAGPDLRQLLVGSEGVLGVITEVTLRVRHLPGASRYEGVMLPSYAAGLTAFRVLAQAGLKPDVMRLSDDAETATTLAMSGPSGRTKSALDLYLRARGAAGGVLAILGWEGTAGSVKARREAGWALLRKHGAVSLGARVGESWRHGRYSGPYLRDVLLDEGYLVETFETATDCRCLPPRQAASVVATPRTPTPGPLVMAHSRTSTRPARRLRHGHRARRGPRGPVVAAARGHGRDRGRRRHHHPPPRGRARPRAVAPRRGGRGGHRRAAGGQGHPRPRGHPQPRGAASAGLTPAAAAAAAGSATRAEPAPSCPTTAASIASPSTTARSRAVGAAAEPGSGGSSRRRSGRTASDAVVTTTRPIAMPRNVVRTPRASTSGPASR